MEKEIQIIKDFVEGKIDINQFKTHFEKDKHLQKLLKHKMNVKYSYLKKYDYQLYNYLKNNYNFKKDWDVVGTRYELQGELIRFLAEFNISCERYMKYKDEYDMLISMQPSWLQLNDQSIIDNLLANLPQGLSRAKQIAWGKEKLKEMFKYDKTYPRWVQGAEWPIKNGQPLVFSHQKKLAKDDERVLYYFYDPQTKEEEVVEQLY